MRSAVTYWFLALLGLLTFAGPAQTVPAPKESQAALEQLEKLKKRLPGLVAEWQKAGRWVFPSDICEVKLVRRLSPVQAKITIGVSGVSTRTGQREPDSDQLLTIYIQFFEGSWTTTRFEATWGKDGDNHDKSARFLMLAIDEAGEK